MTHGTNRTRPAIYDFRLGAFEVFALLDAVDRRSGLQASFAVDQSPETLRAFAEKNFISAEEFEHHFIPTLVKTASNSILFDTGLGQSEGGALLERLATLGLAPADIDTVILTHGHPDHVGGLLADEKPVFRHARHYIGKAEFTYWTEAKDVRDVRRETRELFLDTCAQLTDQIVLTEPGQEIVPGITAIDASGHSPGMMAFRVHSEGKSLLIWSDAFLHYAVSIQRPEWQAHFDDDKEGAVKTRKRLLALAANERLLVAGFHMPFPGLGFVEATPDSFRWVPVSHQLNS